MATNLGCIESMLNLAEQYLKQHDNDNCKQYLNMAYDTKSTIDTIHKIMERFGSTNNIITSVVLKGCQSYDDRCIRAINKYLDNDVFDIISAVDAVSVLYDDNRTKLLNILIDYSHLDDNVKKNKTTLEQYFSHIPKECTILHNAIKTYVRYLKFPNSNYQTSYL